MYICVDGTGPRRCDALRLLYPSWPAVCSTLRFDRFVLNFMSLIFTALHLLLASKRSSLWEFEADSVKSKIGVCREYNHAPVQ